MSALLVGLIAAGTVMVMGVAAAWVQHVRVGRKRTDRRAAAAGSWGTGRVKDRRSLWARRYGAGAAWTAGAVGVGGIAGVGNPNDPNGRCGGGVGGGAAAEAAGAVAAEAAGAVEAEAAGAAEAEADNATASTYSWR